MSDLPISVRLDGEAINRAVVDAILESTLGDQVRQAIEKALKPSFHHSGSVIEQAVQSEVHQQVRIICRKLVAEDPEVSGKIRAAVRARITDEKVAELADAFVSGLGLLRTEDMG